MDLRDKLGYIAGGLFMVAAIGMFVAGNGGQGALYTALGVVFIALGTTTSKRKDDDAR